MKKPLAILALASCCAAPAQAEILTGLSRAEKTFVMGRSLSVCSGLTKARSDAATTRLEVSFFTGNGHSKQTLYRLNKYPYEVYGKRVYKFIRKLGCRRIFAIWNKHNPYDRLVGKVWPAAALPAAGSTYRPSTRPASTRGTLADTPFAF